MSRSLQGNTPLAISPPYLVLAILGRFDRFAPASSPSQDGHTISKRRREPGSWRTGPFCIAPSHGSVSKTRASISLLCLGAPLSSPLVPFFSFLFLGQFYGPRQHHHPPFSHQSTSSHHYPYCVRRVCVECPLSRVLKATGHLFALLCLLQAACLEQYFTPCHRPLYGAHPPCVSAPSSTVQANPGSTSLHIEGASSRGPSLPSACRRMHNETLRGVLLVQGTRPVRIDMTMQQ